MSHDSRAAIAAKWKDAPSRAAPADRSATSTSLAVCWLRSGTVALAFLFPLFVLPGMERPFSTPKFFLLGGSVVVGVILAACCGLLGWPSLPGGFRLALFAWLAAVGASAALEEFVSPVALWLPLLAIAWFWLAATIRPRAELLASALVLSGAIVACVAVLQYIGLDPFRFFGWTTPPGGSSRMRVFATLGNPNFVAAFLVAVMPLAIALGKIFERPVPFSILLVLDAAAVFATGSRAAILALAVVLLWLAVLRRLVNWRYLAVTATLIAVLLLFYAPSRPLKTTLLGRYYVWHVTAAHLADRPLFGWGPGAFAAKYAEWETEYWREGRGLPDERQFAALQDHAHNDYLETLVDHGAAGVLSFVAVVLSFLFFAFRQARRTASQLVTGASAGVLALVAVALVDFPFRRPTELFLFWTLMAVGYLEAMPPATARGVTSKDGVSS